MMDNNQKDIDQLSQNYQEMDETGKEKLKEFSEKILEIWKSKKEVVNKTELKRGDEDVRI